MEQYDELYLALQEAKDIRDTQKSKICLHSRDLSIEEFNRLYLMIADRYGDYEKKRLSREGRKKDIGQGRKFKLDLIDRLLMLSALLSAVHHIYIDRISL